MFLNSKTSESFPISSLPILNDIRTDMSTIYGCNRMSDVCTQSGFPVDLPTITFLDFDWIRWARKVNFAGCNRPVSNCAKEQSRGSGE